VQVAEGQSQRVGTVLSKISVEPLDFLPMSFLVRNFLVLDNLTLIEAAEAALSAAEI
jgi:hypothetical protein